MIIFTKFQESWTKNVEFGQVSFYITHTLSPTKSAKTAQQTTKWYEEIDYYDDEEIEEFNRETSTAKNSRHSLETDEDSSEHEKEDLIEDAEAADEADGVMAKLFHPTRRSPSPPPPLPHQPQPQNQPHRPRAPTSEKLEKYKFMLINIGKKKLLPSSKFHH